MQECNSVVSSGCRTLTKIIVSSILGEVSSAVRYNGAIALNT